MRNRHRTTTAITGILGGVLLITGCGAAAAPRAAEAPQSSEAPQRDAGNVPVSAGGGGRDIGTSNCSEADFITTASPVEEEPGSFILSFGNRSDKTCTINGGWPNLDAVDMSNTPISELPIDNIRIPEAPKEFTLAPGQSVYAGVGMILGDKGDPNSYVVSGFEASLPDMSDRQPVNIVSDGPVELAAKSLRISSLVPSPDMLR